MSKCKGLLLFVLTLLLGACTYAPYLPNLKMLGTEKYGAEIQLLTKSYENLRGELLVQDSEAVYLLMRQNTNTLKRVSINEIKDFRLQVAHPVNYSWNYIIGGIFVASHGYYAMISLPINLLLLTGVCVSSVSEARIKSDEITIYEVYRYARFPSGFPPKYNPEKEALDF